MSSLEAGFSVTKTDSAVSYDARNTAKRARLQGPEWVDSSEERYSEALRDNCERDRSQRILTMSPQIEPLVQILVSPVIILFLLRDLDVLNYSRANLSTLQFK